ncbi:MAG: PAS domain-containing protein [Bryobacteraceae bacterium]|jgi:two-component system cell cycle sensor histidine kinase/response regulator CckA
MAVDSPPLEDAAARERITVLIITGCAKGAVVFCKHVDSFPRSPLNGSVFALALTAAAVLATWILRPYLEPDTFTLFILAVWLSAWYYGRAGGFTAAAASAVAILYFFLRQDTVLLTMLTRLGTFVAMAALITWVTAAWRESRRLLAATLSSIGDAVVATDREGRVTFLNPAAETLTGWPRKEARGKPAAEILKLVEEKTREPIENPLTRVLRERAAPVQERAALISRNGAETPVEHCASPVRDESAGVRGAILVFRDIGMRRQLEEQATHAEKMDAVGRLAGGVAGDFNNVLTVITGFAELLRAEVPAAGPLRRFVDEIIYAGERAAALTRHLLTFSRGSTAQPRVLDLGSLASNMGPMLGRLLGQNVELILLASPGTGLVKADASQMEQAIVNLATNARDAMPDGGKVVIEVASVDLEDGPGSKNLGLDPGPYVMIAVSDTGVGMDAETRSHLFEPFFTTKQPGKGSGLGLATVYGAVKQSEGAVTVYSQPGCGAIFEIYLPRVNEAMAEPARKGSAKGSETILLVDDEEGVRKLVLAVLKANGYDVLEAGNGPLALAAFEKNAHKIDMVLTDVVMPQMTGFELGRELAGRTPGLKILYMSGYRDNEIPGEGEAPRAFLHKPFTPDVLLTKVREVLDAG